MTFKKSKCNAFGKSALPEKVKTISIIDVIVCSSFYCLTRHNKVWAGVLKGMASNVEKVSYFSSNTSCFQLKTASSILYNVWNHTHTVYYCMTVLPPG